MSESGNEKTAAMLQELDAENFSKAKRIPAESYKGWVFCEDVGDNEGYFSSVTEYITYCADHELASNMFVWACSEMGLSIDAEDVLEMALEEHHEDAGDWVPKSEREALQAILDKWCARQKVKTYFPDRTRAVMLPIDLLSPLPADLPAQDSPSE